MSVSTHPVSVLFLLLVGGSLIWFAGCSPRSAGDGGGGTLPAGGVTPGGERTGAPSDTGGNAGKPAAGGESAATGVTKEQAIRIALDRASQAGLTESKVYSTEARKHDGNWEVTVYRNPPMPGGHTTYVVTPAGRIKYILGGR